MNPFRSVFIASILSVGVLFFAADAYAVENESFSEARSQYLHGNYDEAISILDNLAKNDAHKVEATCRAAMVERWRGQPQTALDRLATIETLGAKSAQFHSEHALALLDLGRSEEALEQARLAVKADREGLLANWVLGQTLEHRGKIKEAIRVYSLFDFKMTEEGLPGDAESLTILGQGFYRYSLLTKTNLVSRIRHILREVYQEAFDVVDKSYWPARLAAAQLLADRDNYNDARVEYEAVLAINPKVADALVGLGRTYLADWDFETVEEKANAALEIDAEHVGALLLLGDCRMIERRFHDAVSLAQRALLRNPESIAALGQLAAAEEQLGNSARADELLAKAKSICEKPGAFYLAMGRWFSAMRQYPEAASWLEKATDAWPWNPEPLVELGLLYLESGREPEARPVLEKAFELDAFNERTYHVLGLLDNLEKFATLETEHFIIKHAKGDDEIAMPYIAEMLEGCYSELVNRYDIDLKQKTIIEIFPSHDGFSLRIAHRGFIATIGACTGPVIAMLTPRGLPPFGQYNWADVLRHEFVHTVTLAATRNRIPHWMTEGLAVLEEPAPRDWGRLTMLTAATRRGKLFTLESINWGFWRPPFPGGRAQAYAQSEWMMEYIIERFGEKSVGKLLKAFNAGDTQDKAFKDVLSISTETFDADFQAWAKKQVDGWNLPWMEEEDVEPLREKFKEDDEDSDLAARLAQAEFVIGEHDKAIEAAETCLKVDSSNLIALEVMSRVLVMKMLASKDMAERDRLLWKAAPYVRKLHRLAPDHSLGLIYLGYIEQGDGQHSEAIKLYNEYQQRYPLDPDTYRRLAAIYEHRRDRTALLSQLERLLTITRDDLRLCGQVAKLQLEDGDWDKAIGTLRIAMQIDPFNVDVHGSLADAYLATGKLDLALREYEVVTKLAPRDAIGYEGMADVYARKGDLEQSEKYRARAAALGGSDEKTLEVPGT